MQGDTSREIETIQFRMIMELSPNERIGRGCEMFMAAREMAFASLPPDLTDVETKKRYYELMYGDSLPLEAFAVRDEES